MKTDPLQAALARADHLIDLGRYDEVESLLREATSSKPTEPILFCMLARCRYGAKRHAEAVWAAEKALSLDPENEWAHRLRALALLALKKREGALHSAREAVRLSPDSADAHIVLTRALALHRAWGEAYESAYWARAINPQSAAVHVNLGHLSLMRQKWADAESHLRKALEIDPTHAAAMNNLGVALEGQRKKRDALEVFARSSRTDPRVGEARENATRTARRLGGIGALIATWFVVRSMVTVGRQPLREDGWTLALSLFGTALAVVVVFVVFMVVRTWRRARKLEPVLARFVREQQLARVGLGPRAHEYFRGRILGVSTALAFGLTGAVVTVAAGELGWRVVGGAASAASLALLVSVVRSWSGRRREVQ